MLKKLSVRMLKTYVEKRENLVEKRQDLKESIKLVLSNQRGAGAVEYALIIAVVVAMVISVALLMRGPLTGFFNAAVGQISTFLTDNKQ